MSRSIGAPKRRGSSLCWLVAAFAVAALLLALGPLASALTRGRVPATALTSDPADVTGAPWYVGGVSDLTLFVWAAAATAFLIGALGMWGSARRTAVAFGWFGSLTLVTLLDDRFLLHEKVIPEKFGVPELAVLVTYGGVLGWLLVTFGADLLRRAERDILVVAVVALSVWLTLDLLDASSLSLRLSREAAKMLGAVCWASYPMAVVVGRLRRGVRG